MNKGRPRDLLVTTHTPALGSGHGARTYGIARALAAHRGLDVLYVAFGASEPARAFREIPGTTFHEALSSRGARRMRAYLSARLAGVPADFARGVSPELSSRAQELAAAPERARVIADGPTAAAALAQLARSRPVIYNAHNLESGFRGSVGRLSAGKERALRAFERTVLERSSESWMVSEAEVQAARELCASARLRYVPNVIDVAAILPVYERIRAGVGPPGAGAIFVASFAYEPNRNALRFLLDEVFPRVWGKLPDATLILAGTGLGPARAYDPRVHVLGFVEDLAAAYSQARCAVVPLLQGGGTPLKLIEALAYGLPVIATPKAVAGLDVHDGEHCIVAQGAEHFAEALIEVLHDGAPELARRGHDFVAKRYSVDALTELLTP